MKTLITHINPHLDDICAIWLFIRLHPDFKDVEIEFISAAKGNIPVDESEDMIYLGVGRGRFDEHKGDLEDCAASLVWKYLKEENFAPSDEIYEKALEELVEYVKLDDLGKLIDLKYGEFSIPGFIRVFCVEKASRENLELGFQILDRVYQVLINKQKALKDWDKRLEFETKWGKGVAVVSEHVNRSFCDSQDGSIFLMKDPKHNSIQFYTPKGGIDLEPVYIKVKELDPDAGWFLHQSHKMVICGSGSAPDSKPTKLTFEELTEVLKTA